MPVSLGIDDEDSVDVVRDLESSFDIQISDSEAAACRTLGDIYDLLVMKFSESDVGGQSCASAMAFYRLRSALTAHSSEAKLRPSTPLATISTVSVRRLFKQIHMQTGLKLPSKAYSWMGWIGASSALLGIVGVIPISILFGWWAIVPVVCIASAFVLLPLDPGRFPKQCETLGELSTKVSRLNFGQLAKAGARVTERELWNSLTEVVSRYSSVAASEMHADALLLRKQRGVA